MNLDALTPFERNNYEEMCAIEKSMSSKEDFDKIHNFFKQMGLHYDYHTEKRPLIVFSTPAETGTCGFRLRMPLFNLGTKYADKYFIAYTDAFDINMMKFASLIIQHRASHIHLAMNQIEKSGPRYFEKPIIVHEVDDNEFDLPDSHPLKAQWLRAGKDKMSIEQITKAHFITTTGRVLRNTFSQFNSHDNIQILPNAFRGTQDQGKILSDDERENTKPESAKGKTTIGGAGLTSHFPDLMKMLNVLKNVQDSVDDKESIHFILSGMPTKDIVTDVDINGKPIEMDTPEAMRYKSRLMNGFESFVGYVPVLGEGSCTFQDVLGLHDYGTFYDQYDINLAYLAEQSKFNKSKSAIKVIEGFRKGAVSVGTQFGGYQEFHHHLPKDLKKIASEHMASENDQQFVENVVYWITHPEERKFGAKRFQEYVTEKYDLERINDDRYKFYSNIIKKHI